MKQAMMNTYRRKIQKSKKKNLEDYDILNRGSQQIEA